MNNPKLPITGAIETDNKTYSFYLNDYSLIFLDNVVNSYESSTLKPVEGFAKAMSHNGHEILLYVGQYNFPVVNAMRWGLSSYIVSKTNVLDYDLSYYDGIVFVGGTIAKLKHPRGMKMEYDEETKRKYIQYQDDCQKFSFTTDDFVCDVTIGSSTNERHSHESTSITNGTVYMQLVFDKRQPTSSVYKHYGKIRELLSFLTDRDNVGFDEMYLLQKDVPIGEKKITGKVAQVFIKQEKALTQKPQYHNLEFEMLGDSVGRLLSILYTPTEKKKSYSLNIYPENDEKETQINNEMVRGVCSALECELAFVEKITSDEIAKIKALRDELKVIIDNHKTREDRLKDKTYSVIESSMSHWSMAAADQIKALYHLYDEEMTILNQSNRVYGDQEIEAFVKYRNDITHGSYRVMDATIAYMTYLLSRLVYCCVLTRIGVPREAITQWCRDGRLTRN